MNPFEIFIAYLSWGTDGKNRPVLVVSLNNNSVLVFPITTQYDNKSIIIQNQYFKINDWKQAGLTKQSYVDTGMLIKLPLLVINKKKPIGRLTLSDKQKLLEFLNK